MHDTSPSKPDIADLFQVASGQQGYITSRQARECGVSNELVTHHVGTGRFIRIYRGIYRFRDYPSSPREHVAAAWLAVGKDHAVVSHESALDLLDLTDVIPYGIHITVPRGRRYARKIPGVILHTAAGTPTAQDIQTIEGVKMTSATRTIVDVAEAGLSEEHVERAVAESLQAGMTSVRRLRDTAANRSRRVRLVIERAIAVATSEASLHARKHSERVIRAGGATLSNAAWRKRSLPQHFAVLGGPNPPDALGFMSDRIQVIWNSGDEPWKDPGQHHHTDSDEVFIVFKGSIELEVGDDRVIVGPSEMCFFPAGVLHGVVEVHTPVQALVIRSPAVHDKVYEDERHGGIS